MPLAGRGPLVVLMGVAGSGKSTIGRLLAEALAVPFCEGDDLHAPSSVAKMAAGIALEDADRLPWLDRINAWLAASPAGGVVSCSALRRLYRDRLRRALPTRPSFVLLEPSRAELERRLIARTAHFMPVSLLDSQLATLEPPAADEAALILPSPPSPAAAVDAIMAWLAA